MFVTLQLSADLAALLCGTLERAANQYSDSPNQRELFERVEAAVNVAQYYCPDHKYNPPPDSGITLCPQCEVAGSDSGFAAFEAEYSDGDNCWDVRRLFDELQALRRDGAQKAATATEGVPSERAAEPMSWDERRRLAGKDATKRGR